MLISVVPKHELLAYFNWYNEASRILEPLKLVKTSEEEYEYEGNQPDFDEYDTKVLIGKWVEDKKYKIISFDIDDNGFDILYRDIEELETALEYMAKNCNPVLTPVKEEDNIMRDCFKQMKETEWNSACKLVNSVSFALLKAVVLRLARIASYFNI